MRIELLKERRVGACPVLLAVGLLGAAYELLNFAVRSQTLLSLPMAPMDMLLTQMYGVTMILNMFGIIAACCLVYTMEFHGGAIRKMHLLPIRMERVYLCKLVLLTSALAATVLVENLALLCIGKAVLPHGTFEGTRLASFGIYTFITSLPVMTLMLLIASRFENIWIPLGTGVLGFLSGMALGMAKGTLALVHPFIVMLRPAIDMNAYLDGTVLAAAAAQTALFVGLGLFMAHWPVEI